MTPLLNFDEWLFHLINVQWTQPWLDVIFPVWREKTTWIPLYLLIAVYSIWQYRAKGALLLLALILTVGITDTLSHRLIKKQVQRPRPCQVDGYSGEHRTLIPCGSGYSFTSNHATNHFGIAAFLAFTLGLSLRWTFWWFFVWAFTIAYGQVYVGVHYPLDVICGALLGTLVGWLSSRLFRKWVDLEAPSKQSGV